MKGSYWYKTYVHYCPVCGGEKRYRERVYSLRPTDPEDRWVFTDYYDYCQGT